MLRNIINYTKRKKNMKEKLKENYAYFSPGEYIFDESLMFIYQREKSNYKKCLELFGDNINIISWYKKIILSLIKKLFFNKTIIIEGQQKDKLFFGTVFFIGIDKNSTAKVFDFSNKKVLKFYFSEKQFNQTIHDYNYFKNYLNTPKIISFDPMKLLIIEELINFKSFEKWSQDDSLIVINDIFEKYIAYFKSCKNKGSYFLGKPINLLGNLEEDDKAKIYVMETTQRNLMNKEFPYLKLHGDLWAPNILLSKGNISYIDFEYTDHYLLFYDIFWFIHDQVINHNNYYHLNRYLTGTFDKYFDEMFKVFDLTFEEENRLDYLNLYFLNVYEKRWSHLGLNERNIQLNNYKNMLKMIKSA